MNQINITFVASNSFRILHPFSLLILHKRYAKALQLKTIDFNHQLKYLKAILFKEMHQFYLMFMTH